MSLLNVDPDKCKRDGFCIEVCPACIIEFKEKEAFPTLIEDGESFCIQCGHCVAVCPHDAMSHQQMSSAACPPVQKKLNLTPEQMEQFLRNRRSIRVYKDKPVEKARLTRLIDIARYAPSGHNLQPVNWLVIYKKEDIRPLAEHVVGWMRHLIDEKYQLAADLHLDRVVSAWEEGSDRICRNAPHLIVAHAPKEDRTAPAACTIALAYLELAATALGLGACWAGYFHAAANFWPPMQEALSLPGDHIAFGFMMVGFPKFKYQRLPLRNKPKITWK
jgi:nitroreductase/NAD-dependent dihydropyrimidine dehydrogenase PreA subunit